MIGPKSANTLSDGDHNTQIGHNTGQISVSLTFAEHEAALEKALARKAEDLERAHGAEKELIQRETAELKRRLRDVEADHKARLTELAEFKAQLAHSDNRIERDKLAAAYAALDRDDTTLAEALFTELESVARARREDAARKEANLAFELGKIAESAHPHSVKVRGNLERFLAGRGPG